MSDEFDDLLGGAPEPPRRRPRQPRSQEDVAAKLQNHVTLKAASSGRAMEDVGGVQVFRRPVSISFLATVFEMDKQTITKRLVDCPFVESTPGRKLYAFKEACAYIVKPKMTAEQFVRTLNSAHLPPEINKAFWDGQRSRVRYKLEAQESWDTPDVLEVFGDAFMTIKDVLSTAVEEVRERAKLSDEQAVLVEQAIDTLRDTLRQKLVEMPTKKQTGSVFEKPLFGVGVGAAIPSSEEVETWADEDAE